MLEQLQQTLSELGTAYHYFAHPNTSPPYMVWAEDSANDLEANNAHAEKAYQGTIDLYTKTESEPLRESIPQALESIGAAYYLDSVQYESDTGLIHVEWVWEVLD